jgi:hypothetical protein
LGLGLVMRLSCPFLGWRRQPAITGGAGLAHGQSCSCLTHSGFRNAVIGCGRVAWVTGAVALLIFWTVAERDLFGQRGNEVKRVTLKKVVMPVYLDFGAPALAVMRADRIYPTHQRLGYFRLGLRPMLECDGVTLEICDAAKIAQALAGVRDNLKAQAGGMAIEMRDVAVRFTPDITPRLRAGTIRFQGQGEWLLSNVVLQSGTNLLHLRCAYLQVTGPQAGQVTWESGGTTTSANLLADHSTANNLATTQRNP